jgi:hypothetical protein
MKIRLCTLPSLLLLLLTACDKPSSSPSAAGPPEKAMQTAVLPAQAVAAPPKAPYPSSDQSPPRTKRKLRKEFVEFQEAWEKAVAAGEPEAFVAVRERFVDPKTGNTKMDIFVSTWESMEEGVSGDMSFGGNPFDLCVEHGLAPWRTVAADSSQPVQVLPGGILSLKLNDGFEAPNRGSESNSEDNKYSIGSPLLAGWPGLSSGNTSGWFLGTDKKTGEKKPFNFFTVSTLFFIPDDFVPGAVKRTVRLPWKKPVVTGLEDAEITEELTLDFAPAPKPDNETLLSLWAYGLRLGTEFSKEQSEAKNDSASRTKENSDSGKLKPGLLLLAWADRLMQQFTRHPDANVSKMAGSLAARADWQQSVVNGYDAEVVAKMIKLLRAAAELRDTVTPPPVPKTATAPQAKKRVAPKVVIENSAADLPVTAELVPIGKLAIMRNDSQYQWDPGKLVSVDLSKETGKAGLILHFNKTDDAPRTLTVPTLSGTPTMALRAGEIRMFTVTKIDTGKLQGFMLASPGTLTFIWLVDQKDGDLPLEFPASDDGHIPSMKATLRLTFGDGFPALAEEEKAAPAPAALETKASQSPTPTPVDRKPPVQPPVASTKATNWPAKTDELRGQMEVRVKNPNTFTVKVGLRSEGKGLDFEIGPDGIKTVTAPAGRYDIYFQYSSDPDGVYQGDSFTLNNEGVEIMIVKEVNGSYGTRKVK